MKHRSALVSNSSSASFVVHWRMRTFGKTATTERALGNMFGVYFKEDNENEIDWDKTWNAKEMRGTVEDLIKSTERNEDGTFTTVFNTTMMNSAEDFGESAKSLAIGLIASDNQFQIIDAKVENYGG